MNSVIILLVAAAFVAIALALAARSRRANDGVDSFRRQIDALSPEARRPVIDQVQSAAGRPGSDDDEDDDDEDDDEHGDGVRGA